jgi:hypothetical protein
MKSIDRAVNKVKLKVKKKEKESKIASTKPE